jgi:hypothetical protein
MVVGRLAPFSQQGYDGVFCKPPLQEKARRSGAAASVFAECRESARQHLRGGLPFVCEVFLQSLDNRSLGKTAGTQICLRPEPSEAAARPPPGPLTGGASFVEVALRNQLAEHRIHRARVGVA